MKVEDWPIEKVTPYARNPRQNAGAVAKVKASLQEFDWQQPIVVDGDGVIVVGHTRHLAAIDLGMKTVPVHTAAGLSKAQIKAYRIADNRTAEEAMWDLIKLAGEIDELELEGFDTALLGFGDDEFRQFGGGWGDSGAIDDIEATDEIAQSRLTLVFDEADRDEVRRAVAELVAHLDMDGLAVA